MNKIRVGAVSYLNTKPLLLGIKNHEVINEIVLKEDYPARIADMLLNDEIDLGLVPVAIIPRMKEYYMLTEFCIGSDGEVASVCIFSEVAMENIKTIILDNQSRTSVALAKILLKDYWKHSVDFVEAANPDYCNDIKGYTAAVVIGDRALEQRNKSRFTYDLGLAWKNHTGLPFVYAAWIANKRLAQDFIRRFGEANALGLYQIDKAIEQNSRASFDLGKYYRECISYQLNDEKKKGLNCFLEKLRD